MQIAFFRLAAAIFGAGLLGFATASCAADIPATSSPVTKPIALEVFKSPTCSCCEKWVAQLDTQGFQTHVQHPADLNQEKLNRKIAPRFQSCHTAVSAEGYVFEGHVPGPIIKRFLAEKPKDVIGLAVPGMPMGSPGMEMGDHFDPYDVLALTADGKSRVYAHIGSPKDQL